MSSGVAIQHSNSLTLCSLLPPTKLYRICDVPEIFENITKDLSTINLLNLVSSCKYFYQKKYEIWNINKHLRHFLRQPVAFRSLMATHHALVSGSDALQFFARTRFASSDLDVYIEGEQALLAFADHLISVEKYTFLPYPGQHKNHINAIKGREEAFKAMIEDAKKNGNRPRPSKLAETNPLASYEMKSIEAVLRFDRDASSSKYHRQIQLIATTGPPLYAVLNDFYATLIFNFYDWKTAFSIFPKETFLERLSYMTQPETAKIVDCHEKYRKRNWIVRCYDNMHRNVDLDDDSDLTLKDHGSVLRSRRVGDKFSWMMSLDTSDVEAPYACSKTLEYSTFGMAMTCVYTDMFGRRMHYGYPYLRIRCAPYCGNGLRQPTLVVDNLNTSWGDSLKSMFDKIGETSDLGNDHIDWDSQLPIWWEAYQVMERKVAAIEEKMRSQKKIARDARAALENYVLRTIRGEAVGQRSLTGSLQ
ncbi:hypothetical protein TWF696_005456 [Orbilia brochopaga]|uniref:F-box domain-containing protein n=1 Tax=Orbilia brochopaga TaxID=3140254 RepID=A0AAV9V185_9PEZI